MLRPVLLISASLALAACASAPGERSPTGIAKYADDPRLGEETRNVCFASSIDGFSMNDRSTVLLHDGKKRYMVEVSGSCFDLDNAESIGLDTPTGCLSSGDSIVIGKTFGEAIGPRKCMIKDIYLWNPDAKAEDKPAEENPS